MAVRASIGRVRVTSAVSPGEPGYIRSMKMQMDHIAEVLNKQIAHIKNATAQGMAYALEPILEYSQTIVPVDTGELKASGFIVVQDSASGPVAVIGYARHGQPKYAAFVHEMIHVPHQKGKSAKFLEIAVNEKIGVFERRLVRYIKEHSGLD